MTLPTVFDLCTPRQDVRDGSISDSDFAANLSRVYGVTLRQTMPTRSSFSRIPIQQKGSRNFCPTCAGASPDTGRQFLLCFGSIRRLAAARPTA